MREDTQGRERAEDVVERFTAWLRADTFTCLGARAALHRGELETGVYGALGDREGLDRLCTDLGRFVTGRLTSSGRFHSFAAIFTESDPADEETFEELLWEQLGALHRADRAENPWAPDVSNDPRSPRFGFSFGGHPFFVIGLHRRASRISRRFAHPTLVFNSHRQFAELKRTGVYQGMQTKIRSKEEALQGHVNPMLAEHGEISEARQYSGRAVPPQWTCPFDRHG
ncbi:guanitoxin biosynthesis heme-dependent pre-guanitoxin N-hydroxylase GntA [Streptomyces sp. NPDC047718]|uniref:guanitoxin biosynthesis heme-dependent pre-guanitoxin N-hydroxylase GntA n=1 Tax=Streptomyces sp. NPDC047718 TaxID=3155479 RepID=UPI0033E116B6